MRAILTIRTTRTLLIRITPACAGNTLSCLIVSIFFEDHPRVCGQYYKFNLPSMSCIRITPACAGNTAILEEVDGQDKDHPRVCGEYCICLLISASSLGSPPRVRGILCFYKLLYMSRRITPACAGNTMALQESIYLREDHPRVCGEYIISLDKETVETGSPPRVRGIPIDFDFFVFVLGITPACAGNTPLS